MPYKVIDKKTQTPGDHWRYYNYAYHFQSALIPCMDIEPPELLEVLDNLNPGILTSDDKISIANTLLLAVHELDVDEQSLTRTRVFESKEMYDKFTLFLSGVDLESLYPTFHPLKYTSEIILAIEI